MFEWSSLISTSTPTTAAVNNNDDCNLYSTQ